MTKGKNGANYIFWIRELQPTVQTTPQNQDKGPDAEGPIDLHKVRFAYPLRPDTAVLNGISLEVTPPPLSPLHQRHHILT